MAIDTGDLRVNYDLDELLETQVSTDPFTQFEAWFTTAQKSSCPEPNAMVLATVQANDMPAARVVLLKEVRSNGFIFYTNYESRKGQELAKNPRAALVFNWLELQRQVRIEGRIEKISQEDSTAYFQRRPKGSQIGAWASPQSKVIVGRSVLEERKSALEQQYAANEKLPRPPQWGGYIVLPELVEFWQGRSSRLHDRLQYTKDGERWRLDRLAP
ncbi:MAG: pyridoxamine 5'-phosphate oxidase [Bacteroidota bacterium]